MIPTRRVWLNPAHAADFRADLFKSARAAEAARSRYAPRIDDVITAVQGIVRNDREAWVKLEYQLSGQGQRLAAVICPAADVDDVRSEIEDKFGAIRTSRAVPLTPGRCQPEVGTAAVLEAFIPDLVVTSDHPAAPWALRPAPNVEPARAPPDG